MANENCPNQVSCAAVVMSVMTARKVPGAGCWVLGAGITLHYHIIHRSSVDNGRTEDGERRWKEGRRREIDRVENG